MGKSLNKIAQDLKDNNKKVQLIYTFNGTGKTRLSKEFKALIEPKTDVETEDTGLARACLKIKNCTKSMFFAPYSW